uniref:SRCR domain-containing protein n=1 Tax=Neobodo designis TaxID=312471 RepID=A0A7S1Q592_NEODS|mmetsp:Transcript_31424/g.97069  ORF Transcript_31424/g.97069 Transcript_31424/m.97069 type:complete len:756 (+) Transcript_31424:26-2293(+)
MANACPRFALATIFAFAFAFVLAAVAYTPPGTTWQYRIGDTVTRNGGPLHRLEVRPGPAHIWGTVAGSHFDSNDAAVACRSLGLPTAEPRFGEMYTYGRTASMPIYMILVSCPNASISSLDRCPNRSHYYISSHYNDIGIHCTNVTDPVSPPGAAWSYRLADVTSPGSGRLEIQKTSGAAWGTVCDDRFGSVDAAAACRSLGFDGDGATAYTAGGGTGPILMDETACTSSNLYLEDCRYSSSNDCSHVEDVGVHCINPNPAVDIPGGNGWQVRLGAGEGPNRGRLFVRPSNTTPWGTVCNQGFTARDAVVACNSLGYNNLTATLFFREYQGGAGHVYMRDLTCGPNDQFLTDCTWHSGDTTCPHSYDIGVDCTQDTYEYRLVGGAHNYTGRLEVRPNASLPWGTVCATGFTSTTAVVACESVFPGMKAAQASWTQASATVGIGNGPIYLGGLSCRDRTDALGLCSNTDSVLSRCTHADDVALSCAMAPWWNDTEWSWKLSDDVVHRSGSFEYRRLLTRPSPDSPWGTVCDDYWPTYGAHNADTACNALGLGTDGHWTSGYTSSAANHLPIWLDDVHCNALESTLTHCPLIYAHDNCGHSEDVLLDCRSTPAPTGGTPAPHHYWTNPPYRWTTPSPPSTPVTKKPAFIGGMAAAGVVVIGAAVGGFLLVRRRSASRRRVATGGADGDLEAATPTAGPQSGKYAQLGTVRSDTEIAQAGAPPPFVSINSTSARVDREALAPSSERRVAADTEEIEAL